MSKDQDIEKLFQDSFENFEISPPADLKDQIDKKIILAKPGTSKKLWYLGVFAALILAAALAFFYKSSQNVTKNSLANNHEQTKEIQTKQKETRNSETHQEKIHSNNNFFKTQGDSQTSTTNKNKIIDGDQNFDNYGATQNANSKNSVNSAKKSFVANANKASHGDEFKPNNSDKEILGGTNLKKSNNLATNATKSGKTANSANLKMSILLKKVLLLNRVNLKTSERKIKK